MNAPPRFAGSETRRDWFRTGALLLIIGFLLFTVLGRFMRTGGGLNADIRKGLIALKENRAVEAKQDFERALAARPEDANLYAQIVQGAQALRSWETVAEYAQRATQLSGKMDNELRAGFFVSLAMGLTEARPNHWKQRALAAAEEANRILPKDSSVQNMYGYLLADLRNDPASLEKALQLIRTALQDAEARLRDPSAQVFLSAVLDSYGWVLYKRGDHAGAVLALTRAIDAIPAGDAEGGANALSPEDIKVYYYHLGVASQSAGRREEAQRAFEMALKLAPNYKDAQAALAALKAGGSAKPNP